jgi:hypothetical protein
MQQHSSSRFHCIYPTEKIFAKLCIMDSESPTPHTHISVSIPCNEITRNTVGTFLESDCHKSLKHELETELSRVINQFYTKIIMETGNFNWEHDLRQTCGDCIHNCGCISVSQNETDTNHDTVEYLVSIQKSHFTEHTILYNKSTKKLIYKGYTELRIQDGGHLITYPYEEEMDYDAILEKIRGFFREDSWKNKN